MKTNVADTSIKAYYEILADGQIEREQDLVLRLVEEHQPTTSRQLMYLSRRERGNITRTLFNLVKAGKLKIAFTDKCKTTNKTVRYYTLATYDAAA